MQRFGGFKRSRYQFVSSIAVCLCLLGLVFGASSAAAATTLNVNSTADTGASEGACGNTGIKTAPNPLSLREAVCLGNNIGGEVTINIQSGAYKLENGELTAGIASGQIERYVGAGAGLTTIDGQGLSRVFNIDPSLVGGTFSTFVGMTIQNGRAPRYGGGGILDGNGNNDSLTIEGCAFNKNVSGTAESSNPAPSTEYGGAVGMEGGTLVIKNSTFTENNSNSSPGSGVAFYNQTGPESQHMTITGSTFTGNRVVVTTNNGSNSRRGGAVFLGTPKGSGEVSDSVFRENQATTSTGDGAAGAAISVLNGKLTVSRSSFIGNSVSSSSTGLAVGSAIALPSESATVSNYELTLKYNRIVGNTPAATAVYQAEFASPTTPYPAAKAAENWWGCNAGPGGAGCDGVSGTVTTEPRLQFKAGAAPAVAGPDGSATISGNFFTDSVGGAVAPSELTAFNGAEATWSNPTPAGATVNGKAAPQTSKTAFSAGKVSGSYVPNTTTAGTGGAKVVFDNQEATPSVTIDEKPVITGNPSNQTVLPGATATFTASATGTPSPTVQWQRNTGSGFTNIPGATSTTYSFTTTSGETGYQFRAVFTNTIEGTPYTATSNAATLTVGKATTTISTTASNATIGGSINDTATLSGGASPTGTITFKAYSPGDTTCSATTPAFTSSPISVIKNGSYESGSFTPGSVGEYRWTAVYSGDANNEEAVGACNAANEKSGVSKATPSVSTNASNATIGGTIHDSATFTNGVTPGGTIIFNAYGPGDTTCSAATPAFTSPPVNVTENGSYDSGNFTPATAGEYRWTATYSGDAKNNAVTGACNATNEKSTVAKVTPTISTTASQSNTGGAAIFDTATLAGGHNPTGTIVFKLFGPTDTTCTGKVVVPTTDNVTQNGTYESGAYGPPFIAGEYRWTVEYSGDANNAAVTEPCNSPNETSGVGKATAAISTTASNATLGGAIHDTATISGGVNPTGTITFKAYAPGDTTCSATTPAFTSSPIAVNKNGSYESGSFTPGSLGEYRWTAVYSGDANNNGATSACNAANETSTVGKATPGLSTNASSTVFGGQIHDTATLSGGVLPSGTITFRVFAPGDTTCATALESSNATVIQNGSYESAAFTAPAVGAYRWTAVYSGDTNNNEVSGACNAANETSSVSKATPSISTNATDAAIGGEIHDTATFTGGVTPGGTIVFRAYAPGDTTCSATPPAFTSSPIAVIKNGSYESGAYTPGTAGEYRWTATYSGDANNEGVAGPCNATGEKSTIAKATPTLSTLASQSTTDGPAIADSATLAGGYNPGGTIVFKLFAPGDTTCTGTVVETLTTTNPVTQNGTYQSVPYGPPVKAGDYRWTAAYSGDANNTGVTEPCNAPNETSTIGKATTALSTTASSSTLGGQVHDTGTLSGAVNPTGTITFSIFAAGDTTCAAKPAETSSATVTENGSYESAAFTAPAAGDYRWTAVYSGDANNSGSESPCNAANETSSVGKAGPAISTAAIDAVVGSPIHDIATLTGGQNATGKITFTLYGPDDANCSGTVAKTLEATVAGNGQYGSGDFSPAAAGTYRWVAAYEGDANNKAATSACNDSGETSTVSQASPTISTAATNGTAGGAIHDTATLAAGVGATGKVTFKVYGPDDATCSGSFKTLEATVSGNGEYGSGDYKPAAAGTYRWVAAYEGDANNKAATSACNDSGETSTVAKATPTISTAATNAKVGATIHDTATIAAGVSAGGTITFRVFGPGDTTCSTALDTKSVSVTGNGSYDSPDFTPATIGEYRWTAGYSGDANNEAATSACNALGETSTVAQATPALSTEATDAAIGSAIEDVATLAGGHSAGGKITFDVYGPDDANCSGTVAESVEVNVTGDGNYASGDFTPAQAGEYRWVASYSGDTENEAVLGACNGTDETSVVAEAEPTLTTAATDATIGGAVHDTAMLAGGQGPGGTLIFEAFAPGDETCTGTAVKTVIVPVTGNDSYGSGDFTPAAVGAYHWVVEYSGDANNTPAEGACGDSGETSDVAQDVPTITSAATGATLGAAIHDTAKLAGGHNPGGTLTFSAYGPNDSACTGAVAFTKTVAVGGAGEYGSTDFTPSAAGEYRWVVTYSGDADNRATAAACGDAGESSSVAAPAVVNPPKPIVPCLPSAPPTAGGYVPKTTVPTGLVNGVRARIHVGEPSSLAIVTTLIYRRNGQTHRVDLGSTSLENPGTRNLRVAIPASLREVLPLGTPVRLALTVSAVPAGGNPCSGGAKQSHLAVKAKVVRVLLPK